jgi:hypothetical protein
MSSFRSWLITTGPKRWAGKFRGASRKRIVDISWMEIRETGTDLPSKIEAVGFIGAIAQAVANH